MKRILHLLLLCTSFSVLGQSTKKEYLHDENGNEVGLEVFKAKLSEGYIYSIEETDTTFVATLVLREETGVLSNEELNEIKYELSKLSGKTIDQTQILIVHFFAKPNQYSPGNCIDNYVKDAAYKRFLKKNPQYVRFNITEKGYTYSSKYVNEDINGIIHKFFKHGSVCGNYMIIQPDGNFFRMIGEYIQKNIPDKLAELENN